MSTPTLDLARFYIRELTSDDDSLVKPFACDDDDLDDFLRTDALRLQEQHVVRTYLGLYDNELAGYISLLADVLELKTGEKKKLTLSYSDHPMVPALKIARLAVAKHLRTKLRGFGTELVRFAHDKALNLAEGVGCRLLTVDAYPRAVEFYQKLGFLRSKVQKERKRTAPVVEGAVVEGAVGHETPSMWLDLFAPNPPPWVSGTDM